MEAYLGTILLFGFSYAPLYWAICAGATLPIAQNQALYALLGTSFGGDGKTTFALPDMRGRVPCGMGHGSGLSNRVIGEEFGQEETKLTANSLFPHNHLVQELNAGNTVSVNSAATVNASNDIPDKSKPDGAYWGKAQSGTTVTPNYSTTHDTTMASDAVQVSATATFNAGNLITSTTGTGLPFDITQPSLTVNFSICTQGGTYPSPS